MIGALLSKKMMIFGRDKQTRGGVEHVTPHGSDTDS